MYLYVPEYKKKIAVLFATYCTASIASLGNCENEIVFLFCPLGFLQITMQD